MTNRTGQKTTGRFYNSLDRNFYIYRQRLWVVLILSFNVTVHAKLQTQQNEVFTAETFACTLYQVASQQVDSKHAVSLHCEDDQGLSYEVKGLNAAIKQQYFLANQAIENKLMEGLERMTGIKATHTAQMLNAKSKLRQQLKQAAHPKLMVSHFQWFSDKININDQSNWQVDWDEVAIDAKLKDFSVAEMSNLLAVTEGLVERTALVIHVTANDFSTTATPTSLGDSVFGTDGDAVNLASQYSACSYDQFNFLAAQGQHIVDGVVQLTIDMDVQGISSGTVRNAVVTAGNELFGSLFSQADHIMFALPPNTDGSWIAYASVNGSSSVYNDNWATYVSAQMHELGHNLGMGHSGIGGNEYADTSGMMGYSYSNDDGPLMCFNSAKSSKFGWYNNKELTFFEDDWLIGQGTWSGKVIGLADYDQVAADQYVLLKIHTENGNVNSSSLNINFNRDAGINSGTRIGKDRLMVVSTNSPTGYNTTLLEADLGIGESHTFANYWLSGTDLIITVNDISTDVNGLMYADVEISVDFNILDIIFGNGFDL
ncbi:hypothetical protein [Marinicella litoralis]|uniref:Gametolysin peptidase M11 n=1 Tax=Marinicella litoralis TaxID=644220 RepID=A0A4R6XNC9_9GAMM|nr:hypothetical protein [Marinicella litoralis]TDR19454.1 gametolysin peptidase M11 [Marinicella litoralis]